MNFSEFLARLESKTNYALKKKGDSYSGRCPGHGDKKPSLSIKEGDDGRILVKCHVGCELEAIVAALGLSKADLFPKGEGKARGRGGKSFRIVATYPYHDKGGKVIYEVCRLEPKDFRQRRPDMSKPDGWAWNTTGISQVPFRLPELIMAVNSGATIFVAEGEKDVEALVKHGFAATCNAGGAGKWRDEFGEHFAGAKSIVVIADKDTPGRAHANAVANKLRSRAQSVKLIELPDMEARPVKDAADFFAAGGTADKLRAIVAEAPEYVPKAELTPLTPGDWFKQRFPKLAAEYGEPVYQTIVNKRTRVQDISEDFMAATLGLEGTPDAPTVFLPAEERFYTYNPKLGIFERERDEDIASRISNLFLECVRECRESADLSKLEFSFRDSAALAGIVKRAKALLSVEEDFFSTDHTEFLPVANGILRISDRELLPFCPSYRYRHRLATAYDATAYAPRFMQGLLSGALDKSDVTLIQRWSGLVLVGHNISQKILLLTGTAGGGKSTLVSVLTGIIGNVNVGMLRTELLGDRFEIGRLMGKTLLYGPDVPEDFLSKRSASCLKSLTGGDVMTAEFKNSNEAPQVKCQFNMIVTSNSRLTVYLEGDADAWRRRLVIVNYERAKPENPIPNFAEKIIAEEGPGVLNFMLDGLDALRGVNWQLSLNERQQRRVDDLLLESDAHRVFVTECLIKDTTAPGMTKAQVHAAFVEFCDRRGWIAMNRNRFGKLGTEAISQMLGLTVRGDIRGEDGKQNDGWKNLRLRTETEVGI